MCILTFIPEGVQPDADALRNGAKNNPDGHGFAIVDTDRNQIVVRHNMDASPLIDLFLEFRAKLDGPALFHSRIATAGLVDKMNCHPFRVGDDPLTVVGHNGVLPQEAQPVKGDWRSDTRIFAEKLLPMRNLDGRRSMKRLAHWLGGDKLVILTVNPTWEANAYLVNSKRGEWDYEAGIWYSNGSYRDDYNTYRWYGYGTGNATRRKCPNYDTCEGWTFFPGECLTCRGDWGRGKPLALESGDKGWLDQLSECAMNGCRIQTTELFCYTHSAQIRTAASPSAPVEVTGSGTLPTRSPDPCLACEAKGTVSTVTMVCTACYTCQDCMQDWMQECLCYVPGSTNRDRNVLDMAEFAEGTVIG